MKKLIVSILGMLFAATASAAVFEITITGPGGHSNGNYGNTNAVHAGSRAVLELEKAIPCAGVSNFKGGATVNAIAADAAFLVDANHCPGDAAAQLDTVTKAVKAGCEKENAFRSVKDGDMVRGFPADIKFFVKEVK